MVPAMDPVPTQPTDPTIGPSPPGDAPPVPEGVPFGRYVIERAIGRGGMGTVFRAWDTVLGRAVALKTLLPGSQQNESPSRAADLARFRREAQSAGRLRHPNVIAVFDVGEEQDTPFFTMELIDGVRLDRWLLGDGRPDRARPTFVGIARVVEKTARALHTAHQEGIVHRDVKPGNVLVDPRDEPHLGDFGLAKAVDLAATGVLTLSGEILGTPQYMSPEQALGEVSRIGPASDIFSLGSVLYFAIAGTEPFKGTSLPNLIDAIAEEEPRRPSRIRPEVPRDLEAIALHALEKEPRRRYASALEMAEDLARFVSGVPVLARPPSAIRRLARATARQWPWLLLAAALGAGAWYGRRALQEQGGETERLRAAQGRRAEAQDLLDSLPRAAAIHDREGIEATLPILAKAIDADPTFAPPCLARAVTRQKLGDFRGALADYDRALDRDPALAEAHFRRGFLLATREVDACEADQAAARESYEAARRAAPDSLWASLAEVGLDLLRGDAHAALAILDRLAHAPDREADVFLLRASLRGYRYRAKGVHRVPASPDLQDLEAAVADLDVAIELDPVSPWARGARGLCRFDLGDLEGSRQDLIESYRLQPDLDAAYFIARVAYMQGDRAASREWVGESIERGGDSGLRRFRAFLDLLDARYDRAAADLDLAIQMAPDEVESYPIRALVRYAKGDREGATEDLETYRRLSPKLLADLDHMDKDMSRNVAAIRMLEAQLKDMERILFLPPERKKQLRDVQRVLAAFKWFTPMIRTVREGARNSPDSMGLLLDFSRLAEERKELAGASEFLVHGLGLKSGFLLEKEGRLLVRLVEEETLMWRKRLTSANDLKRRAAAYYRRSDMVKALGDLEEAARLAPSDSDVLYGLATLRAMGGTPDGAMQALSQAMKAGWSHPEYTRGDPDFASIADREEFGRMVGR